MQSIFLLGIIVILAIIVGIVRFYESKKNIVTVHKEPKENANTSNNTSNPTPSVSQIYKKDNIVSSVLQTFGGIVIIAGIITAFLFILQGTTLFTALSIFSIITSCGFGLLLIGVGEIIQILNDIRNK